MRSIEITNNESGQRLDRFLRKLLKDEPLGNIYQYIRKGIVKVNNKKAKENYRLRENDIITLYNINIKMKQGYEESNKDLNVVYEDNNIIIINKPPNVLSHPERANDKDTLIQRVMGHISESKTDEKSLTFSPALCNRLDRNTPGLVIAAKNYSSLKEVNKMMREKGIVREYLCVVRGVTDKKGEIKSIIGKDKVRRIGVFETRDNAYGKRAITKYERLYDNGEYSILRIQLITGRFHQIRIHLSGVGYPIVGDPKYGDRKVNDYFLRRYNLAHQFLIAYSLCFENPPSHLIYLKGEKWKAELPIEFKDIIKDLFGDIKI